MEKFGLARAIPIAVASNRLGLNEVKGWLHCPGHSDTRPSLRIYNDQNSFFCFSCRKGGSPIDLVMLTKQCTAIEAVAWLLSDGRECQVEVANLKSRSNRCASSKADPEIYEWFLNDHVLGRAGYLYLRGRGFDDAIIEWSGVREVACPAESIARTAQKWGQERVLACGLAFEDRIRRTPAAIWAGQISLVFPVRANGKVIYLQARSLPIESGAVPEATWKYSGLRGLRKPLYNVDLLERTALGTEVFVCEGIPDSLAALQLGLNAVGVLGAYDFNRSDAGVLARFRVTVLRDQDRGGAFLYRAIQEALSPFGNKVRGLTIKGFKDLSEGLSVCRGENGV